MGKFINPFTDVGFKIIFGQEISKPVLIASPNKKDRMEYDHALKRYRDTLNAMTGAEQKGRAEERADTARSMKADGMPIELITKYTGLTAEEIAAL